MATTTGLTRAQILNVIEQVISDAAIGMSVTQTLTRLNTLANRSYISKVLVNDEELRARWVIAKQAAANLIVDEIVDVQDILLQLASNPMTSNQQLNALRQIVDNKKWMASKFYPRIYGTTPDVNVVLNTGQVNDKPVEATFVGVTVDSTDDTN